MDPLTIAGETLQSRLMLGTARYPSPSIMKQALEVSGCQVITVSMRSLNLEDFSDNPWMDYIDCSRYRLLPNTAGCYSAYDAIYTAELAREALKTSWIKLEVIGDDQSLLPDGVELLKAAEELVKKGFSVFPYCPCDPILCKRLEQIGCIAVMPLASPIGSGRGLDNPYHLQLIKETVSLPVFVDAGIGTASDVTRAMELGLDGVLLNSAVAGAYDPINMALSMAKACEAGRLAYLSGRIPKRSCGYSLEEAVHAS